MSTPTFICPRCARSGFYATGLKAHVCRGARPGEPRRRLNRIELAEACDRAATEARPQAVSVETVARP